MAVPSPLNWRVIGLRRISRSSTALLRQAFSILCIPPDVGHTQSRLFVFDFLPDSAVLPKLVVQPLDIHGLKLIQLDLAQFGADVGVNEHFVVDGGALPDSGLGIDFIPQVHPLSHRVHTGPLDIQVFALRDGFLQFFLDLCLGLAQDILDDGLAGNRVSSRGVPTFPAAIFSLSQAAFAVCPAFCHSISPPSFLAAHTIP